MPYMIVRHKVEDYARWKALYDEDAATRKAAGSQGTIVFRTAEDPNNVIVLLEWDDLANAQQFTESDSLRETMQKAGVMDMPDVYFLNKTDQTSF